MVDLPKPQCAGPIVSMHLVPLCRIDRAQAKLREVALAALPLHDAVHQTKIAVKQACQQLQTSWSAMNQDESIAKLIKQRERICGLLECAGRLAA
jgi:hypothetical protein